MDAQGYKTAAGTYAEQYQAYGVSGTYVLAPGFLLQSDLMFVDEDLKTNATTATKVNSESYVWVVSTRVNF